MTRRCRPSSESFVNPGKSLALDLVGTLPVIWGGTPLANVAARRFAAQLSANASIRRCWAPCPDRPGPGGGVRRPVRAGARAGLPVRGRPARRRVPAVRGGPGGERRALRLVLLADEGAEEHPGDGQPHAAASLAGGRGIDVTELRHGRRAAAAQARRGRAAGRLRVGLPGLACGIDPLAIAAIDDLKDLTEQAGVVSG